MNHLRPNYYLDGSGGDVVLLKLHGSINWLLCKKCNKIYPWHINEIMLDLNLLRNYYDEREPCVEVIPYLAKKQCQKCQNSVQALPFIIPPTESKLLQHKYIDTVWQRAAHELKEAKYIYVSGYSLPQTDYFFKYLFALGSLGSEIIRQFKVFDPDPAVEERFKFILSTSTKEKFTPSRVKFEQALQAIAGEFDNKD